MNIFRSALSLVIHKHGFVEQSDIDDLLAMYRDKDSIVVDVNEYRCAVNSATEYYRQRQLCLFVCTGLPCGKRMTVDISYESAVRLSEELDCPVELTGCHWRCEEAPAATLKLGDVARPFDKYSASTWSSVLNNVKQLVKDHKKNSHTDLSNNALALEENRSN